MAKTKLAGAVIRAIAIFTGGVLFTIMVFEKVYNTKIEFINPNNNDVPVININNKDDTKVSGDNTSEDNFDAIFDPKTGKFTDEFRKKLRQGVNDMVSSKDGVDYKEFFDEIEKQCPYYQSDGATYRACLFDLFAEYEKAADSIAADLIKDTNIVIAEIETNPKEYPPAHRDFLNRFIALNKMWRSYRDALCLTNHAINWSGSNYDGILTLCKLYETYKYINFMLDRREEWVEYWVSSYSENNTKINTKEFKELIEGRREILDEYEGTTSSRRITVLGGKK